MTPTTDKTTEELLDVEAPIVTEEVEMEAEEDGRNEQKSVDDNGKMKTNDVDKTENDDEGHEVVGGSSGDVVGNTETTSAFSFSKIKAEQLPLAGHVFASMIFLIAVAVYGNSMKWYGYALSVGTIGMVLGLGFAVIDGYFDKSKVEPYHKFMAGLFLVWASIGAFIFTFANESPFQFTGNGYFALWCMVITASMYAGLTKDSLKEKVSSTSPYVGLLICAVIMIIATSFVIAGEQGFFSSFEAYRSNTILMICIACLTVPLVGGILYQHHIGGEVFQQNQVVTANTQLGLMVCFCILWIVSAGLCTFQGPFQLTGNGYFASWGGAILSAFALSDSYQKMQATK